MTGAKIDPPSLAWTPPYRLGETLTSEIRFDVESVAAFATMIRDHNPLHHDAEFAAQSRFGGLIASGGQSIALLLGALAEHVAARSASLGLECAFALKRAVKADSVMSAEWTVTAMEPKPSLGGHIMSLEGALRQADGAAALTATLKMVVMPKEALGAVRAAH